MYKNVLLTEHELKLLHNIVHENFKKYPMREHRNLTILLNQLKRSIDNKAIIKSK